MTATLNKKTTDFSILIWICTLTIMVLLIIVIGGLTRLTDSGLSMVDWRPILGIIPPLSEASWQNVFEQYKLSPEYIIVNKNMTLEDFKFIFWWEWFHRFFARLIGFVFIIPFFYFLFKKRLSVKLLMVPPSRFERKFDGILSFGRLRDFSDGFGSFRMAFGRFWMAF